ncbi:MAG: Y-family DNA polymerase, partial [Solirubrobacteraceae bacterium]
MIACVHLPRFELAVAAGGRAAGGHGALERSALAGRPLAVAPSQAWAPSRARAPSQARGPSEARRGEAGEDGGAGCVGEVSAAAEAHGIAPGMALSEALVRCPKLELVPADPLGVAEAWEEIVQALEGLGAAVETPRPGLAYFEVDGLLRLHRGLRELLEATRRACAAGTGASSPRIGIGPTRFCALAAALAARPRRGPKVFDGGPASARHWLAAQPLDLLRHREETAALHAPLRKLGLRRLGELEAIGADALADRFGAAGARAHRLISGHDSPLSPRRPRQLLHETLELDEADIGPALERLLLVLVERLLARREREGRALRSATISARLVEGGTWRQTVVFKRALDDGARICLALAPHL